MSYTLSSTQEQKLKSICKLLGRKEVPIPQNQNEYDLLMNGLNLEAAKKEKYLSPEGRRDSLERCEWKGCLSSCDGAHLCYHHKSIVNAYYARKSYAQKHGLPIPEDPRIGNMESIRKITYKDKPCSECGTFFGPTNSHDRLCSKCQEKAKSNIISANNETSHIQTSKTCSWEGCTDKATIRQLCKKHHRIVKLWKMKEYWYKRNNRLEEFYSKFGRTPMVLYSFLSGKNFVFINNTSIPKEITYDDIKKSYDDSVEKISKGIITNILNNFKDKAENGYSSITFPIDSYSEDIVKIVKHKLEDIGFDIISDSTQILISLKS